MNTYFNINYEFDKAEVHSQIEKVQKGYICVADGVVLNTANRNKEYLDVVNGGMFAICDSSWVPLYLKSIYGVKYEQYCGSEIFKDIVSSRKYRMIFMGTQQATLDALQKELIVMNPDVANMKFVELPFRDVDGFDYQEIAQMIKEDGAKIIWVALGAPKQERFMNKLLPYLESGVMLGVGAVFKFYSGTDESRCPKWIQKNHLEFVYRIIQDPKKQLKRCFWIVATLPKLYLEEVKRKRSLKS
ncbi:WecB/TagA/CpsF family glycosyltransferase [Xylanibacter ruminicola]|uniref:WecB/TagA/CpsF family glycosyltransferase n=1 Tax=Xylanibacter ruminicola TaxID=839 RepID=UPI00048DFBF6|nr:WecB/TagA/CpsF family glycosyltransferase [Xylanibacter ruminicola]